MRLIDCSSHWYHSRTALHFNGVQPISGSWQCCKQHFHTDTRQQGRRQEDTGNARVYPMPAFYWWMTITCSPLIKPTFPACTCRLWELLSSLPTPWCVALGWRRRISALLVLCFHFINESAAAFVIFAYSTERSHAQRGLFKHNQTHCGGSSVWVTCCELLGPQLLLNIIAVGVTVAALLEVRTTPRATELPSREDCRTTYRLCIHQQTISVREITNLIGRIDR